MKFEYLSFFNDYKSRIETIEGVTKNEIHDIESTFNVKLPKAYIEYLLFFGRKSGNLLNSYYMEYPALKENKQDAIYEINFDDTILLKDKPIIKDSYFFFAQWQGYNFYFFDCDEVSNNPIIYLLLDAKQILKYKDSFSDFIYEEGLKPILTLNLF